MGIRILSLAITTIIAEKSEDFIAQSQAARPSVAKRVDPAAPTDRWGQLGRVRQEPVNCPSIA